MDQHGADALRWYMARQRLAVGGPPGRGHGAGGDRPQGPPDVLEHRVVLRPVRQRGVGLDAAEHRRRPRPRSGRCWTAGRSPSCTGPSARWTRALEEFDTAAGRAAAGGVRRRPVQLVRPALPAPVLGGPGDPAGASAFATLYECLETLTRLMAPIVAVHHRLRVGRAPRRRTAPDSVHLAGWPAVDDDLLDPELTAQMALVRRLVELGRSARAASGVRTRQPLGRALVGARGLGRAARASCATQIADELNVQGVRGPLASIGGDLVDVRRQAELPRARQAVRQADPEGRQGRHLRRPGRTSPTRCAPSRHGDGGGPPRSARCELAPGDVIVTERPRSGWAVESAAGRDRRAGPDRHPRAAPRRAGPRGGPAASRTPARPPAWRSPTGSSCGGEADRRRPGRGAARARRRGGGRGPRRRLARRRSPRPNSPPTATKACG